MKNIITTGALILIIVLQVLTLQSLGTSGDMNNDGILNIVDLSILASTINDQ